MAINPNTPKIGSGTVEFYRDLSMLRLGQSNVCSISTCRVVKRQLLVTCIEYHSATCEGILPIDGDILIHVAHATPNGEVPVENIKAFWVPKGTFVTLNSGVWHYAPFPVHEEVVNVMIMLPERTYANDCKVVMLEEEDYLMIEC